MSKMRMVYLVYWFLGGVNGVEVNLFKAFAQA